eukprot:gene25326-33858_t
MICLEYSLPSNSSNSDSLDFDNWTDGNSSFTLQCHGQVKSGNFGSLDYLYCRYTFHFGNDWSIASGLDTGLSQTACRNPSRPMDPIIWNFPIDLSFSTTNVFGWPRIALSVYGVDFLGRDVIRGYGSALIPLTPGSHNIKVDMFAPIASSYGNQFVSWLLGNPPEFFDSKFVCQGEGREVSRVQKTGEVHLTLNTLTKGMQSFGYVSHS